MLCWGQVGCKQLGLTPGQYGVSSEATHSDRLLKHGRVQHICCGDGITVFVFVDRKVLYTMSGQKQRKLGYINEFKKERIHFVDSEASRVVFITEGGNIFSWTLKENRGVTSKELRLTKPELLKTLCQTRVIQVACGKDHSLALCKDGQLIAWGQNAHGQLGLGTKDASHTSPQCLKSMAGIPIAQIAAGGAHSFALSVSGAVFGWGRNDRGQLGLGDTEDRHSPTYVKQLEHKKIVYISCGEEHTATLTKDGSVFTFGAGSLGQLGHNTTRDEIKPRLVAELFGAKVSQIACGSYHTLVFVPSSGKVYAFGQGEKGQLGSGQTSDQLVPLPVKLASHTSDTGPANGCTIQPVVSKIFAGVNQSFAECFAERDDIALKHHSSFISMKGIATVDDLLLEKWSGIDDGKLCKSIKTEINHVFSSAASLNGSFLETTKDNHFKTSNEVSGVDMSAMHLWFEKLQRNVTVLQEVTDTVKKNLMPSLLESHVCVETLRVYLILPELIEVVKEQKDVVKLTSLLSRTILSLEKSKLKILESLWNNLNNYFFKKLVMLFKTVCQHLLQKTFQKQTKFSEDLHNCLRILQKLYEVNCFADLKVAESNFYIALAEVFGISTLHIDSVLDLIKYPCIINMETKVETFNNLCAFIRNLPENEPNQCLLVVRRSMIIQDTLKQLMMFDKTTLQQQLQVIFEGEFAEDYGGVSQEFFSVITKELCVHQNIFKHYEDSRLIWFPEWEPKLPGVFRLVGILCGIALHHGFVANFHFPLALYKKLLNVQPTIKDLKELSKTEGRNLDDLLHDESSNVEEVYGQYFVICKETDDHFKIQHELIPNGQNIPVEKHNRKQFVDAYVDYIFNTSVEKHFKAFAEGFRSSFPKPILDVFLPEELMAVVHGNTKYEWELLEQQASYTGYTKSDQYIVDFWTMFHQLPKKKKKNFLAFLTGCDRIPVGGMGTLKIVINELRIFNPDLYYPIGHTCNKTLDLPRYSNIRKLRKRFLRAIESYEVFGIQ
uniref:Probable E3 ubiquitin-protein ligase HERC3 n=1 Tax=Callorhinchus milii TaxID=7868 RepID=A0A4W3IY26_CALMI